MSKKRHPKNVFCTVRFLDGSKKTYQFPKDLRSAMLAEDLADLRRMMRGKLINVPISVYRKGRAKLTVAKIDSVFYAYRSKPSHLRTRGQFIDLKGGDIRFLLHDHSLLNKLRIRYAVYRWRKRK